MEENSHPETSVSTETVEEKPVTLICGLGRRLFAFAIDGIILCTIGTIIGSIFFDFFAELGGWGQLIGSIIILLYFGILNSSIGNGQTFGQRILKIRVVDKNGKVISPLRSFARFIILLLPFYLNGATFPLQLLFNSLIAFLVNIIVFFIGGSIIYLFIFNRKTRQSLHDLITGTFVINVSPVRGFVMPSVWKGHFIIVGILFVAVTILANFAFIKTRHNKERFIELFKIQQSIYETGLVHNVSVSVGKFFSYRDIAEGKEGWDYYLVKAILRKRPENYEEVIHKIALTILEKYPQVAEKDALVINVSYGFNLGIAQTFKSLRGQYSSKNMKEILSSIDTKK